MIKIAGNQKTTLNVGLDFLTSEAAVTQAERDVKKLAPAETKVFEKPQKGWCHGIE